MFMRIYTFFAALLVRAIVAYCTKRGKYVDYMRPTGAYLVECELTSGGLRARADSVPETRTYMRRYVLSGFMTGDAHPNTFTGPLARLRRFWALNRWHLYLHHMHAPDADTSLHDHPWLWAVSWIVLGGYREERLRGDYVDRQGRWLRAPALNCLKGGTFHRISELETVVSREAREALWYKGKRGRWAPKGGTWTLFAAGPRRASKPWGYLVPGRGYVNQKERHAEVGAFERRATK